MICRTRSNSAPGLGTASIPSTSRPNTKPKSSRKMSTRNHRSKSRSVEKQFGQHLITPTFTWDIPKTHKQVIYDDLGVKEMESGGDVDASYAIANKKVMISKKKSFCKGSSAAEVKGHLVSPDQFKPLQEHIHDGHACSCKKQLLLVEKSDDPFYMLSDEIMLGIFRWLPMMPLSRCARVCKRWHHLVFDDTLWRHIDLSTKTFATGVLGQVLQRGTVAAKLSRCSIQGSVFNEVTSASPAKVTRTFARTAKHSKNTADSIRRDLHLQYVDLTASDAKPEQLAEILDRCPRNQIKKLSLESCAVDDNLMKCVANHGDSLEELNLCMCTGLTDTGLNTGLSRCTKLRSLNLGWTNLSRKDLSAFMECAPRSLEKLNLTGCRQMLNNDDIVLLTSRCSAMKELDLSDATVIGFSAIDAIVDHMTELQHIALSRCYNVPRLSFVQLGTLKSLRALDIFGLVQEADMLESMQELLPRIQINIYPFSAIARPTTTKKRSKIWEVVCYE